MCLDMRCLAQQTNSYKHWKSKTWIRSTQTVCLLTYTQLHFSPTPAMSILTHPSPASKHLPLQPQLYLHHTTYESHFFTQHPPSRLPPYATPSLTFPLLHLRPTLLLKLPLRHPPKRSNSLSPRPPPAKDPLPFLPASSYRFYFLKGNDACSQPHGSKKGNITRLSLCRYVSSRSKKKRKAEEIVLGKAEVLLQRGAMIKPLSIHRTRKLARSKSERGEGE